VIEALVALTGTALAAAGLVLGYVYKPRAGKREKARRDREKQCDQLRALEVMLGESRTIFVDQNARARALMKRLRARLPDRVTPDGFEANFRRLHADFDDDERELFDLLRGTTTSSLHSVNSRMRDWLQANMWARDAGNAELADLPAELDHLQRHLDGWLDKYNAMVPQNPTVALVYMADEKKHGLGFPRDLDAALEAALSRRCSSSGGSTVAGSA